MSIADYIWHSVFFLLVFGVPIALALISVSDHPRLKNIDVSALWTSHVTGKLDTMLVIVIGTWWVHTCAAILWVLTRQFSNENVVQYMGWALPIIASWFARRPEPATAPKETP